MLRSLQGRLLPQEHHAEMLVCFVALGVPVVPPGEELPLPKPRPAEGGGVFKEQHALSVSNLMTFLCKPVLSFSLQSYDLKLLPNIEDIAIKLLIFII